MMLENFKEEIYKCSGCGICQNSCPVYKILKTEAAVSRGKFNLLNAIVCHNTFFSKKVLESMDLCLHCGACSQFCPSGIDAQKIIETAKNDMFNLGIYNLPQVLISKIISSAFFMTLVSKGLNIIKKLKFPEIIGIFGCKKNKLLRAFLKEKVSIREKNSEVKKTLKVLYFEGCINKYINSSSKNAVENILKNTEVEVVYADFSCCGLPLKGAGNFECFKKIAKANLDKIDMDFDYFIFDCASCKSTFLEYEKFLTDEYKEKAQTVSKKIISIYELLEKINYIPAKTPKYKKVTIHYPCHTRGTRDKELLREFVQKIPEIEFFEMEEADSCCGAAGSFMIINEKISKEISVKKAENIIKSGAAVVLTACPSCFLGLKQGLIEKNSKVQVMQLIEFLSLCE